MLSQDNLISAPCRRLLNRQNEGPVFVLNELCHCHHCPRFVVHIIQLRNNLGELPFGKRLRRKFRQTAEISSPCASAQSDRRAEECPPPSQLGLCCRGDVYIHSRIAFGP